jgi:hypothetical protein
MAILVTNKTLYSHLFATKIDLRQVCLSNKYRSSDNYFDVFNFGVFNFSDP